MAPCDAGGLRLFGGQQFPSPRHSIDQPRDRFGANRTSASGPKLPISFLRGASITPESGLLRLSHHVHRQ